MRRLLFFTVITLLSFGESRRHQHHHSEEINFDKNKSDKNDYKRFRDLAKDVIDADKTSRMYCTAYSYMNEITEFYGRDAYRLYVPAKGINASDVTLKIKHRVVFVRLETDDSRGDRETVLAKFVTLPDIVDEDKANWMLDDERIKITVPYEVQFEKEMPVSCEDDIDKNTKDMTYKDEKSSKNDEPFRVPVGDVNENLVH